MNNKQFIVAVVVLMMTMLTRCGHTLNDRCTP